MGRFLGVCGEGGKCDKRGIIGLTFETGVKIHEDVFPAPWKIKTRANIIIELEIGHAIDGFGGFEGISLDFFYGVAVFYAIYKVVAKTNASAEFFPIGKI